MRRKKKIHESILMAVFENKLEKKWEMHFRADVLENISVIIACFLGLEDNFCC